MIKQSLSGKESLSSPFEKKEEEQSIDFKDKEGLWHATEAKAESAAILDPKLGMDVVIRNFVVIPQIGSKCGIIGDVLSETRKIIERNVSKDGWTFQREPSIREKKVKGKKVYVITTVLTPAINKWGLRIGATNASPRGATELLKEAAKNKNTEDSVK